MYSLKKFIVGEVCYMRHRNGYRFNADKIFTPSTPKYNK